MIETSVRVVSVADGMVSVAPDEQSGCGGCRSRSSCAVSGLGRYFSNNRQAILVRCDAKVLPGDELYMAMSEADFLKAGVLAYLLPSVFTIAGSGILAALGYGDVGAVAGAALGFFGGLLLVRSIGWVPGMTVSQTKHNKGDTP